MNNNPIGIFDSGVGGLSVLNEIRKELPMESLIYIADSSNCPYGNKSEEFIIKRTKKIIVYLLKHEVKAIVIACNSATVSAINHVRALHPEIPIFGIVPVVKTAARETKTKRIGVLSTSVTSKSDQQQNLIKKFASDCMVSNVGTDDIVPFIERGEIESDALRRVLEKVLLPFKNDAIDTLVLGCSHYVFVKKMISSLLPGVTLLDSGAAVARQVKRVLSHESLLSDAANRPDEFITTGDLSSFKRIITKLSVDSDNGTIRSIQL